MFEMLPFPVVSDDGCCPSLSRRFLEGSRKGEGGVFLPEPTLLESSPGGSHQGARGAHFFLLFSLSKKGEKKNFKKGKKKRSRKGENFVLSGDTVEG